MNVIKNEPALIIGAITSLLALLVSFGVQVTETQTEAITNLLIAVLPLIAAFATRTQVTPTRTLVEDATDETV